MHRALTGTLLLLTTVTGVVSSLGAPLVPTIAAELGVSLTAAQWTLTVSLVVGAVATPLLGRWGAGRRRRRTVLLGLGLVLLGTVLAAAAVLLAPHAAGPAFALLLAGRALQGLGLALTPLAIAAARDELPTDRVTSAVAVLSVGTVAGAGLGYPLTAAVAQVGGLLAAYALGTVLTGLTLTLTWRHLPSSTTRAPGRTDVVGSVLLGAATLAVLLGVSQSTTWGWGSPAVLALVVGGAAGLALWVRRTLATPEPVVDLRLAFGGGAAGPNVAAVLAGAGMYMGLTLVIVLVQADTPAGWGLGEPVVVAGAVLVPYAVMSVIGSRLTLRLARVVDHARVLPLGCATYLSSAVLLAAAHDHLWQVLLAMALAGLGSGGTFATLPVLLVRAVPLEATSSALAFNQVLRYLGFSVGSAIGVTVLGLASRGGVPDERGFVVACLVNAGFWVVAVVATWGLTRPGSATGAAAP